MIFVFRVGLLQMFVKGVLAIKGDVLEQSFKASLEFTMSCVLCDESPTSRKARLLCKHYLSRCSTSGTQKEENVKTQAKKIKQHSITINSYSWNSKLACHQCFMWADNLLFLTQEINSVMRMAQITCKLLSSYEYLTFPVEGFFICSLTKAPC